MVTFTVDMFYTTKVQGQELRKGFVAVVTCENEQEAWHDAQGALAALVPDATDVVVTRIRVC